ncbi:MAG: transcription elongation factor GreA [Minisyncoccia bacterium]
MQIPRRQWSRRPPPNYEPVYLTPEGVARLKARLERLKASLPAAIAETSRTSAYGDRSDNAEYKEAKGILRRTHGQIFNIEDQLKRVVIIPSGADAMGTIQLGSTVIVEIKKDGALLRKTFRILGSSETDPGRGRISHTSPLGAALLGRAAGDVVTVQTPGGTQEYKVVEVR